MPNVPAATGQLYLSSFYGTQAGQTIINTWVHFCEVLSGAPTIDDIYAAMNTTWAGTSVSGGMVEHWVDATAADYTLDQYRCQCIDPIRYTASAFAKAQAGSRVTAQTANNSPVIYRRGDLGSRRDMSTLHMPAISADDYTDGIVDAGLRSGPMTEIANRCVNPITIVSGAVSMRPVIYHRGQSLKYSFITFATPQTTLRTMRRRTVGRGI